MKYIVISSGALPSAVKPKSNVVPTFKRMGGRIVTTRKTRIK